MTKANKQDVLGGIEKYTGKKVKQLDVVEDPKVRDTAALRATLTTGEVLTFLLVGDPMLLSIAEIAENLEECEFKSWPPASGAKKFFW